MSWKGRWRLPPGERWSLDAGGVACLPKRLPHAIRNPLDKPSRYLFIAVPGGLDLWFDAVTDAKRDGLLDDAMFPKAVPLTLISDGLSRHPGTVPRPQLA